MNRPLQAGETIARRQLHDELLDALRDIIIVGNIPPGQKIPEKELCGRFGVSRTPLREALKVLAFEGLVILTPNRGATVAPFSVEDLRQTFPVVGALEALSGELACARATDAEIKDVRRHHETMLARYAERDLKGYFAANERIHGSIQLAARNETLGMYYKSLSARMRRARISANLSDERWAQAISEHCEMIEALEARDGPALAAIMRRHMANKFAAIERALAAGGAGS